MGIYVKTRRMAWSPVPFNEAIRGRAKAALVLLEPLLGYISRVCVRVTRYAPIVIDPKDPSLRPFEMCVERLAGEPGEKRKAIEVRLENVLRQAERAYGTLFETYVTIRFTLRDPRDGTSVEAYLGINNGRLVRHDIELEVYEWVKSDTIIETLEETLEALGLGVDIRSFLIRIGTLNEHVRRYGFVVERGVVARTPDALWDMTLAKAYWLPKRTRIFALAFDTAEKHKDSDEESSEVYDYYYHRRRRVMLQLLVSDHKGFENYLRSVQQIAEVAEVASVIVVAKGETLEPLYRDLVRRILLPLARKAFAERYSTFSKRVREALKEIYSGQSSNA